MSPIEELVVTNLPLMRGGHLLQPDINFSVSSGEILSVHGPNGSGKTSLLRAIAGLLATPHGSITFRVLPDAIIAEPEERLERIGWFGQQDGVKLQLSLLENLRFHCRFNRHSENVDEALSALKLGGLRDLSAKYLSQGQRRRLAFARLLVVPRALWLLDEPYSNIDEQGRRCIRELMEDHCKRGGMVVAATHEPLGAGSASLTLE